MSDKKAYRTWLAPAGHHWNHSFVVVEITEGNLQYESHDLTIGDCQRSVTLEFSTTKKNRKASLTKLGKIYDALDRITEALGDD